MFDCKTQFQEDDELLNYQVWRELTEYGVGRGPSDSEYQIGIAKITEEEVARLIETNQQTQSIEPSLGLLDVY